MSRCPNCSGENADTQRFCGDCGTPLPAAPAAAATRSYDGGTPPDDRSPADLLPGALFARRYQVIEELGTGGMGRVFRVLDRKLDEEIALKLIRPGIAADRAAVARFATELKLARQVVHRNVARMFDLNEEGRVPFITMEYVRGENLKRLIRKVGRLSPGQAIPVACQICDGLAEAHRLGIVHRDLKPQNVMIDEDGQAKIMDFGLALLVSSAAKDGPGSRSGTPAYLSPEQARGAPADARSDLYSLGVVLYEMLTGTTPFHGATAAELAEKHLREAPRDPREHNRGISPELARVVLKCLEKDPAKRYPGAAEVRTDLDRLRATAPHRILRTVRTWIQGHRPAAVAAAAALLALLVYLGTVIPPDPPSLTSSVAVLGVPEASGSGPELGRRLQDALATGLSGIPGLVVVPPITVNSRKTAGRDPKAIGRLLEADYLVEPAFHAQGDGISLTARLINARRNLTARTYELSRPAASDLFAAAEEFAGGVATVIRSDIAEDKVQKSNKGISSNLDARLLVHEGMELLDAALPVKDHPGVFAEVLAKYERALALDPGFALALWATGNAYEARYNTSPPDLRDPRDVDRMCEFYQRAHDENPLSPETSVGLGWAHFNRGDFTKSTDAFDKALRLEPASAVVRLDVGAFLRSVGLYRRAIPHLERAARLAPDDPEPVYQISNCLAGLGRFAEAAARSARAVAMDPNDVRVRLAHAIHLILAGRLEEGSSEIEAMRRIRPDFRSLPFAEGLLAAARGDRERALALKGGTEFLTIPGTCFYLLLGMTGEALDNIEAGIARGFASGGDYLYSYPSLKGNPAFAPLRGQARFRDILARQKARYLKELKKLEDL